MADIKQYTDQIKNAVYGEEVRDSIIGALEKVNDDNNSYQDIKDQITSDKEAIDRQVETFGDMVAEATETKAELNASVVTANTARTNLENATQPLTPQRQICRLQPQMQILQKQTLKPQRKMRKMQPLMQTVQRQLWTLQPLLLKLQNEP